jgi:hypothetical protein
MGVECEIEVYRGLCHQNLLTWLLSCDFGQNSSVSASVYSSIVGMTSVLYTCWNKVKCMFSNS